jgi:hypothetical protein
MKSIVPGGKTMAPGGMITISGGRYRRDGKLSERPGPPVAGTSPTGNGLIPASLT